MKKIYLIRHGQSEDNIASRYQTLESPLTAKGREQAAYAAERAARLAVDAIIASPLPRAKETAEIISSRTGHEVEFSGLFEERRKPAELAGRAHDDESARMLSEEWGRTLFASGIRVKDGENFDDLKTRALRALHLLEKRPEENILVVTHGFFLRVMTACVLFGGDLNGEILRSFALGTLTKNTGLSIFEHNPEGSGPPWKLMVWNDHAHLAEPRP